MAMDFQGLLTLIFAIIVAIGLFAIKRWSFSIRRKERRDYYRNVYLKSDAWQRKRYVVLKRDDWRCVYCGNRATQVHHKRYAKYNIGKEPIDWLVSVCDECHNKIHNKMKADIEKVLKEID
jgi:5-methylcytosine-specific restriction endonuclease McrA